MTLSPWPAILEGTGVDGRKNEMPRTQITMMDYSTVLICVVIGFGGYCEIIRGLKQKKSAPYKNFVRPLSVIYHFKKFTSTAVWLAPSEKTRP